ncbi:hypothetical protein AVEN_141801-1 [Araneus ventricosus]|uniref:Uncharacterized protein n=1 Tax=Araneus ventricosus TaxID=182803 RepID=A0A4Y2E8R8_ARAVE|nr:hypothetical protein AVEN_141801-1 [Araneus ventricosus]
MAADPMQEAKQRGQSDTYYSHFEAAACFTLKTASSRPRWPSGAESRPRDWRGAGSKPDSIKIRCVLGPLRTKSCMWKPTSSRWCGAEVWRGYQFRCHPRHLTRFKITRVLL